MSPSNAASAGGTDLAGLVRERYPTGMPVTDVVAVISAVADTLDDAHLRGVVHGDVTPANIHVVPPDDQDTPRILLTGFGSAPTSGRSDQYGLAATAYYLLTGKHLGPRTTVALPGERRPELSAFDWVFATALSEDPSRQFSSCRDFALALAGGHLGPVTLDATASPAPELPVEVPKHRRRRGRALLIILAVLALIGGGTAVTIDRMHAAAAARQLAADREGARLAGQHYLEALAAGDAATVLSLAAQPPPDSRFLTSDILRSQLAALPITGISVTNAPQSGPAPTDGAEPVLLSATFGTIPSHTTLQARKVDGQWKLDDVTVPVAIGADPADKTVRAVALSGVAAVASPVAVFPGLLQVSTLNPYIDLTADVKPLLLEALTDPAQRPAVGLNVTLNDAGRAASLEAIERYQQSCYTGAPPSYKCCPTGNCSPPPAQNNGVDRDTVRIESRLSVNDITYALDPTTMLVKVSGLIRYDGEAQVYGSVQPIRFGIKFGDNLVDLLRNPPEKVEPR